MIKTHARHRKNLILQDIANRPQRAAPTVTNPETLGDRQAATIRKFGEPGSQGVELIQICGNGVWIFVRLKLQAHTLTRQGGRLLSPLRQSQPGQSWVNREHLTLAVNVFLHRPPREKEPARCGPAFR